MKKLIAGNWKMNGTEAATAALIADIARGVGRLHEVCDFLVCPPAAHLKAVRDAIRGASAPIALGGQDCSAYENGAYTGEISVAMLVDMGCNYVIVGHSERRQYHNEKDALVAAKAAKAHEKGLISIICVGEKEEERESGFERDVVESQLQQSLPKSATAKNTIIAYEPVWAIGTGKTATPEDVRLMHRFIREKLKDFLADSAQMRILYGGSVKAENAGELFAAENVDGGLIGGASLKADQFLGIARAA